MGFFAVCLLHVIDILLLQYWYVIMCDKTLCYVFFPNFVYVVHFLLLFELIECSAYIRMYHTYCYFCQKDVLRHSKWSCFLFTQNSCFQVYKYTLKWLQDITKCFMTVWWKLWRRSVSKNCEWTQNQKFLSSSKTHSQCMLCTSNGSEYNRATSSGFIIFRNIEFSVHILLILSFLTRLVNCWFASNACVSQAFHILNKTITMCCKSTVMNLYYCCKYSNERSCCTLECLPVSNWQLSITCESDVGE